MEIHERLIARFGGTPGIRDHGLLESALFRPQTGYYDGIPRMAAALMESLLMNHAFVDGNKRVAFFLTDTFLRMNGYKIDVKAEDGEAFVVSVISKKSGFETMVSWIERHLVELS